MPDFFPPRIRPVVPVTNIKSVGVYLLCPRIRKSNKNKGWWKVWELKRRASGTWAHLFVCWLKTQNWPEVEDNISGCEGCTHLNLTLVHFWFYFGSGCFHRSKGCTYLNLMLVHLLQGRDVFLRECVVKKSGTKWFYRIYLCFHLQMHILIFKRILSKVIWRDMVKIWRKMFYWNPQRYLSSVGLCQKVHTLWCCHRKIILCRKDKYKLYPLLNMFLWWILLLTVLVETSSFCKK